MNKFSLKTIVPAVLAALGLVASPSVLADESWIEILETYTLPIDPMWRPCIESGRWNTSGSESFQRYEDRRSRAKSEVSRRSADKAFNNLKRKLSGEAMAAPELMVIRGWDGIRREERTLILGSGQSALAKECMVGSVVQAEIGRSNALEHRQAAFRRTLLRAKKLREAPSEFLFARVGDPEALAVDFGEVGLSGAAEWRGVATKSPVVGDGAHEIVIRLPEQTPIHRGYPWWCEFKLMELDEHGVMVREIDIGAANRAVCTNAASGTYPVANNEMIQPRDLAGAYAQVEVENPGPYGYVPVVIRAFGVRGIANGVAPVPSRHVGGETGSMDSDATKQDGESAPDPVDVPLPPVPDTPEIEPSSGESLAASCCPAGA